MSNVIDGAVTALRAKLGDGFDGSAKFHILDEGCIVADGAGVREADEETDVTLSADRETFEAMLAGELDPSSAFMSGRLKIEGDMGAAMKLGAALSG
ncbi:SCP2 sterol-binding domain-containing protein [Mangrovicoccus algicola]|uniref:SCP2 sterol-binding domain-containing protein n=1 Tax=Mangrovicoccus algicola TaxID=2771008 RepID=A0A8J6Z6S4_9RHOB|nr:SCP2 sterol-binding domain-containing protein [Mangrovicoccus algicola]MBE3637505.1 SCP2 sterol-binding domain-containing protein [Mangrovicoccus algicola]